MQNFFGKLTTHDNVKPLKKRNRTGDEYGLNSDWNDHYRLA